jgi:NAD(P)-dependent dehydrogenase (short-subunit alcohol dehydrogenase family)
MQKAIFITGGGSGIGRATAQHFASKGWFVGLADVNASGLAETAALLPNTMSSMHVMDVRDRSAWQSALADFVTHTGGRLDVLFNNAGIGTGGPLEAMDPNDVERVLDINLKGVFWGAQIGFEYLKNTPGSALVSTSSAAGIYASAGMSAYSATKFGVRAMTESLDREWADAGVKARTIMPSFIDTPLLDTTAAGSQRGARIHPRREGRSGRVGRSTRNKGPHVGGQDSPSTQVCDKMGAMAAPQALLPEGLGEERIDRGRQRHITRREPTSIMRGKQHVDPIVDVRPFRVMVGLFGDDSDARHEAESLDKIGKDELSRQRVAGLVIVPFAQRVERGGAFVLIQLLDHFAWPPFAAMSQK